VVPNVFDIDSVAARSVIEVRVRFGETDLMGIVHHSSYVSYFEVARIEWLRRRGLSYATWAGRGIHLPVVELELKYKTPARFDELLVVDTLLDEVRAASLRFRYRIVRQPQPGAADQLIAEGATRLACINDEGALRRFTDEMIAVLAAPETNA
jgi:acyl-CoA thioester hydrolase